MMRLCLCATATAVRMRAPVSKFIAACLSSTSDVDERFKAKYADKLLEKAKSKGLDNVNDLIASVKSVKAKPSTSTPLSVTETHTSSSPNPLLPTSSKPINTPRPNAASSGVRKLDQIVNLELLASEPRDVVERIWNEHHAQKQGVISGVMDKAFFDKWTKAGRRFPMFILPLPRPTGFEFYLVQHSGHQAHYTPLVEYKTKQEGARSHLVLTHYDELALAKDAVLMTGEVMVGTITPEEARLLVLQTQLYYVTGSERKKQLLETFHEDPGRFEFQTLIDELERID